MPPGKAAAGETVLLREGSVLRWVRIVHAAPLRGNGTQLVTVQSMDHLGRSKPRRVTLGVTAEVEWVS